MSIGQRLWIAIVLVLLVCFGLFVFPGLLRYEDRGWIHDDAYGYMHMRYDKLEGCRQVYADGNNRYGGCGWVEYSTSFNSR